MCTYCTIIVCPWCLCILQMYVGKGMEEVGVVVWDWEGLWSLRTGKDYVVTPGERGHVIKRECHKISIEEGHKTTIGRVVFAPMRDHMTTKEDHVTTMEGQMIIREEIKLIGTNKCVDCVCLNVQWLLHTSCALSPCNMCWRTIKSTLWSVINSRPGLNINLW